MIHLCNYCPDQDTQHFWGAWVVQLVKCPTSAQVMISWFMGSSPTSGSVLRAQSLEPASDSVSLSLSLPLPLLTLCQKSININNNNNPKKQSQCSVPLTMKDQFIAVIFMIQ